MASPEADIGAVFDIGWEKGYVKRETVTLDPYGDGVLVESNGLNFALLLAGSHEGARLLIGAKRGSIVLERGRRGNISREIGEDAEIISISETLPTPNRNAIDKPIPIAFITEGDRTVRILFDSRSGLEGGRQAEHGTRPLRIIIESFRAINTTQTPRLVGRFPIAKALHALREKVGSK